MRIIGIDFGEKRIGLAISDELGIAAHRLETLHVESASDAVVRLKDIVQRNDVGRIVVGLPLNMNASEGPQARAVREFVALLERELGVPVALQDERLTTQRAERTMREADLTRGKRQKRRDIMAAQFILQSYLDSKAK